MTTLLYHRGQTRRFTRTRTLYHFYGGSDGDMLEIMHDYEYCTLRTKGKTSCSAQAGIQTPEVRTSMGSNTPILPSPATVNTPMTPLIYLSALEQMLKSTRRYSWNIFDVGVWRFMQDSTTLSKVLRLNYFSVLAL